MSIDTLFNTSWQVLIGVAALWWMMFAALLLQQRNAASRETRDRLEKLAGQFSRSSSSISLVDRWCSNLEASGLTFAMTPNAEVRLVAFKWFLGGLLVTGVVLVVGQLVMFGYDAPPPAELHAARLLSASCLIISGLIAIATVVTGLVCGAPRAINDLARPKVA